MPTAGEAVAVARGRTFGARDKPQMHTMRYTFKPESVGRARSGRLRLASRSAVLEVPAGDRTVCFNGNVEPHKLTEFALICNRDGQWLIEKLSNNIKNLTVARDRV